MPDSQPRPVTLRALEADDDIETRGDHARIAIQAYTQTLLDMQRILSALGVVTVEEALAEIRRLKRDAQ